MNTTNNTEPYDIYELMITFPDKKAEMIVKEIQNSNPDLNLVRDLIALGANVDWTNKYGKSAIFTAIEWRHPEIARMLIDAGADVNMHDESSLTPLHWCVYANNQEIAKMLLDAGADFEIRSCTGNTALDWCAIYERPEIEIMIRDSITERIIKRINEGDVDFLDLITLATGFYRTSEEHRNMTYYCINCIKNKKNLSKILHIYKKASETNCDITALIQELKDFLKV